MARIIKPFTFAPNTSIPHNRCNENFQKIYDEFDGNIDDTNIKAAANIDATKIQDGSISGNKLVANILPDGALTYTSVKAVRMGPNISNNGLRLAKGAKAFEMDVAVTEVCLLIVFAVDSDLGDPIFHASPRFLLDGLRIDSGTTTGFLNTRVETISAARALVSISATAVPAVKIVGFLNWLAFGGI